MRFSKLTGCFYPEGLGYSDLPDDIIDVPQEDFAAAMARNPGETLDVIAGRVVVIPKPAAPLAELQVAAWEEIKAERDRRRFDGGVKVSDHWFLTTTIATCEYNTLLLMSSGLPDTTVLRAGWRTIDGATIDMTPALVKQILFAGFAQVAAIDDAALAHKAAMEASADPSAYDYSTDWPEIYADVAG